MGGSQEDWPRDLERLLAGDRLAFLRFNRLVTGFLVRLRAYDFREEWDDLRQEVLLSLVANARAGRLRDPERIVAYVRIITRNKFIDRLERRRRGRERESLAWDDDVRPPGWAGDSRGDGDDRARDVWREASILPDQQRQVLDGVYRQGKTVQEVADATGIPLGTVKRRLRDALVTLRGRLRDTPGDG